MPDFSRRSTEIEIMDDLHCNGEVVHQTLRELEIINRWLGGNAVTLQAVKQLVRGGGGTPISIADLGCGSGEMLILISNWARKNNVKLHLTGIDANPHIIEFAKTNCSEHPEISFERLDIFSNEFAQKKYDIVIGTLFYHHFESVQLAGFLSKLKFQARVGLVINDIHRHWLAYHSIRLLTRLFSRSSMVKFDAPLSVLRAFNRMELTDLLTRAGIRNYDIKWKWAFRWQIIVPLP